MTNLLYFVLSIYIIIKFINPLINEIIQTKKEIFLIKNRIHTEKKFLKNKEIIEKYYIKALKEKKILDQFFFSPNLTQTQVFTQAQKILKNFDKKNKIVNILWGNVFVLKNEVKVYPLIVYIKSEPFYFKNYIEKICKSKKLFYINYLKINAINDNTIPKYQVKILAFQKIKEKKIENNK